MTTMYAAAPRAFTRAWLGYWLDFVLAPGAALAVAAIEARHWSAAAALTFAIAGFVGWTFVEYWTHRTLLHRFFWHGTHERHHNRPSEYIVFAWWHTIAFFAACFLAMPAPIFVGFVLGYAWFLTVHHWLHHSDLKDRTWLHRYAIWHNRHHKLGDRNYGGHDANLGT